MDIVFTKCKTCGSKIKVPSTRTELEAEKARLEEIMLQPEPTKEEKDDFARGNHSFYQMQDETQAEIDKIEEEINNL